MAACGRVWLIVWLTQIDCRQTAWRVLLSWLAGLLSWLAVLLVCATEKGTPNLGWEIVLHHIAGSEVSPRLHYRLLTLCPAPTDPVPRGLLTLWARAGVLRMYVTDVCQECMPRMYVTYVCHAVSKAGACACSQRSRACARLCVTRHGISLCVCPCAHPGGCLPSPRSPSGNIHRGGSATGLDLCTRAIFRKDGIDADGPNSLHSL